MLLQIMARGNLPGPPRMPSSGQSRAAGGGMASHWTPLRPRSGFFVGGITCIIPERRFELKILAARAAGKGGYRMRRREFMTLLCGGAAWPIAAHAQRTALPVIGFLNGGTPEGYAEMVAAFHRGLKEVGYVVGENAGIEYRWARGDYDRLPALAAELIRLNVAVIVANSTPALAAMAATSTVPIVFSAGGSPVELGLVARMNRPGGNVTGISSLAAELGPKRLQLLHELVPDATVVAILVNPKGRNAEMQSKDLEAAAATLGLQ